MQEVSFIDSAIRRGFAVKKEENGSHSFRKDGWPDFFVIDSESQNNLLVFIHNKNPKAGQGFLQWLSVLSRYLQGTDIVPHNDGSELGEFLSEFHDGGCKIVEVGVKDYFIERPGLLAMSRVYEDPSTRIVKIEILNQLV